MYSRKKIFYVITKSNFGGAQRYVYDLAVSLPREHFDVAVVLGENGVLKEKLDLSRIRTIALPYFARDIHIWNDIKTFFALIRIFKKECPDIIHLNSSKAGILGAVAGRIARARKIIFTAHGWAFNEERLWWQKKIISMLSCVTVMCSHTTIAVSNETKKQVARFPFIKKKIIVIYNGRSTPLFVSRGQSRAFLLSKNIFLNNKKETLWIGTIAELHATKGLSYSIQAMGDIARKFPNIIYIIVGEGERRQQLEEMIQAYALPDTVFLLGCVDNAAQYLPAFDIFLLPSLSEALPYTPIEAGFAKLPVVASAVGGIPEIIEHEKSGVLVPPQNSHAIAEAIHTLLKKPSLREQYGIELFNTVREKFSFKEMLKKTMEIYLQM